MLYTTWLFWYFSPVAKITTIRVLLSLTAIKGWHPTKLDINNVFLHGDLLEEVYMTLPPSHSTSSSSQVCKLHKSICGLKQESRQWYSKLSSFLLSLGFKFSEVDHSLYIKHTATSFNVWLVYMDDVVLVGNSITDINLIKQALDT